jgi:hypothetical protein
VCAITIFEKERKNEKKLVLSECKEKHSSEEQVVD